MKKSVILLILAVYVIAVCIVGFLGIRTRIYNATVDVQAVEITEIEYCGKIYKKGPEGILDKLMPSGEVCQFLGVKEKKGKPIIFKVYYEMTPANASDKEALCAVDADSFDYEVEQVPGDYAFLITLTPKPGSRGEKKINVGISSVSSNNTKKDSVVLSVELLEIPPEKK